MNRRAALLIALAFSLECIVLIPLLGPQQDEVLFASVLLKPYDYTHHLVIGPVTVATMLDFYLGALKAWLYAPLVRWFDTNVYALRLPVVALGAATIYLVYWCLEQTSGRRAALFAAILLAADPTFILTTTFDWGPCVLQRFLLAAIFAGAIIYVRRPSALIAAAVGLMTGLALWDKLSFIWLAAGCAAACLAVFHRELRQSLRLSAGIALLVGALLGAFPALDANWGAMAEARARSAMLIESPLLVKACRLWLTLDGSALYLSFSNTPNGPAHLGAWLLVALLAAIPLWWRGPHRRAILFAALAGLGSASLMFATRGGAAGVHHTSLLWPLPPMLLGLLLAGLSRRALATALLAVVTLGAGWVTASYRLAILDSGAAIAWTDASPALARYLEETNIQAAYLQDWGISGPMRYLGANRFTLADTSGDPLANFRYAIPSPDNVFVFHPVDRQIMPGKREQLDAFAATLGAVPKVVKTIYDRYGHPAFIVVRYTPR